MSKRRRSYTKAEKLEIVKLSIETDQKIKDLADRFEVSQNSIYTWRKAFISHKDASFPGNGNKMMTESEREISNLKKELREAKLERDILKKAVGIFSKNDRKFSNL